MVGDPINRGAVDFLPKPVDPSILKARVLTCLERKRSADREHRIATELVLEKARVDELLNVILPAETVIELKETGSVQPGRFNNVVVLFFDVVNFTAYCNKNSPEEIVSHLHSLFSEFDTIIEMSGLQKIKTIGDSYMAAGNLLRPIDDPLSSAIEAGLNMIDASAAHPSEWQVRVGIHIGEVVAGIIGTRQYQFDHWGDTVNMAARVEAHGQPMCVSLTASLAKNANPALIRIKSSKVQLKGKGRFELVSLSRTTDNSPR